MAEQAGKTGGHRAAIDLDEVGEKRLGDLTAAEFIQILNHKDLAPLRGVIADKKKYELWIEENLPRITLGDLLERVRGEKKKLELEVPPEVGDALQRKSLREFNPELYDLIVERLLGRRLGGVPERLARSLDAQLEGE